MTEINDLMEEANQFSELAEKVQDESYSEEDRKAFLRDLRTRYENWHLRAMRLIGSYGQPEAGEKFNGQYQGLLGGKIAGFLSEGMEANIFHNPEEPVPGLDKWQQPFDREFKRPLFNQLSILAGLERAAAQQGSTETSINIYGGIHGGTNAMASGANFAQRVQLEDVRRADLDSLLGFLGSAGVTWEDLEHLREAVEADEEAQSEGRTPGRVGEWLGRVTGTAFSAGVTGASSQATIQIIQALANYYGVELGG